jgi:hypothetical protein
MERFFWLPFLLRRFLKIGNFSNIWSDFPMFAGR